MEADISQWQKKITLASPYEECWANFNQWKTLGALVEFGCTDDILKNIDAHLEFVLMKSVFRNSNGEASRVVGRGCVRISML